MSTAPKVRERAIRFTDDEIRKLLGMPEVLLCKPIKLHQFHRSTTPGYDWQFRDKQGRWQDYREADLVAKRCRFGKPGDRLWVQEVFSDPFPLDVECKNFTGFFRATDPRREVKWKRAIHMPRWASRLTFEIEHIGVQCLCSEDLWVLSLRRLEVAHGTL